MHRRAPVLLLLVAALAPAAAAAPRQPPDARLVVTATHTPNPAVIGRRLTYAVTVRNAGPAALDRVELAWDALAPHRQSFLSLSSTHGACTYRLLEVAGHVVPTADCRLGALAPGDAARVRLVFRVGTPRQGDTHWGHEATATGFGKSPDEAVRSGFVKEQFSVVRAKPTPRKRPARP